MGIMFPGSSRIPELASEPFSRRTTHTSVEFKVKKSVRTFGRFGVLLIGMLTAAVAPLLASEYYRVTVSLIDANLYRDHDSKTLIETRSCREYATRDEAVLRWEGRHGHSRLIFSSRTACEVVALR